MVLALLPALACARVGGQSEQPAVVATLSDADRRSLDVEAYLTDEYLASLTYPGCQLFAFSGSAPSRRILMSLPDRSTFTLEISPGPERPDPEVIGFRRRYSDGRHVEMRWERSGSEVKAYRVTTPDREDVTPLAVEVRDPAIAGRLAGLAERASTLQCKEP
jgi:hypothetical protein